MSYRWAKHLDLDACEGFVDGRFQRGGGAVAAFRQVDVLDGAEEGLDRVELGRIRRQVVELNAALAEVGQGPAEVGAAVEAGVVQHNDERPVGARALAKEVEQVVGIEVAPGRAAPVEASMRAGGDAERHGVVAASLRLLVRDALALAGADPAVAYRLARGEAALVKVAEGDASGGGLF